MATNYSKHEFNGGSIQHLSSSLEQDLDMPLIVVNQSMKVTEWDVIRLQQADDSTWHKILDMYRAQLRDDIIASLERRHLSHDQIDDIEQSTWITAARRIADFEWRGEDSFYHWLRVISLNHVRRVAAKTAQDNKAISIDQLSEVDEGVLLNPEFEDAYESYPMYSKSPEREVLQRERTREIAAALSLLSPKEADMVRLWMLDNPLRVIAAKYHMRPGAVSMVIHRATKKLRPFLGNLR